MAEIFRGCGSGKQNLVRIPQHPVRVSLQKGYPEEIQNIAVGSYDIPLVKAIFPETEGDFPREFHDPCTGLDFREILQHCRSHRMRNDRVPDLGIGIDPVQGHTVDSLSMVNEARMLSVNLT